MEEDKNNIYKYIPYLGSFVIFLGVERLILYYSAFNINIIHFLEFSEIITSFFDILTFIIIIISFSIIQQFFFQETPDSELSIRERSLKAQLFEEHIFLRRIKLYWSMFAGTLLGGLTGNLLIQFIFSFWHPTNYWTYLTTIILYITLFIVSILIFESEIKHKRLNSNKEIKNFIRFLFIFILIVGSLIFVTRNEVKNVKESKMNFNVMVTLNDSIKLVSDSTNYYIGKTQNYLFFHNEKKHSTSVYPMSKVTEIEFPQKTATNSGFMK